ncbi:MAG: hypothetical protein P3X22_006280 [Thermoprotei archaeon]|nr:hypothetical protein [Thermoprotei archaeon]
METPQHVIPEPLEKILTKPLEASPQVGGNKTIDYLTVSPGIQGSGLDLHVVLILLLLAASALILLLLFRGRDLEIVRIRGLQGFEEPWEPLGGYKYSGLKLELREAYESILKSVREAGLALSKGATATEVSRALSKLVENSWIIANMYNKGMFSAEGPSHETVDSMWSAASNVKEALKRGA